MTSTALESLLARAESLLGRLQRYARSGFRRPPTEQLDLALQRLTA